MERTTVDSLLRSTQAFCSQLCAKETLDYGIAYYSDRFPTLPQANQFREVVIDDPTRIPAAYQQAERWYEGKGLLCYRWAPAGGQPSGELANFLTGQGWIEHRQTAMLLRAWVRTEPVDGVRILPARAMRAAFRRTLVAGATPWESMGIEAYEERLNDPQFDMFVATADREPAGRCALYQVGDIARVMDLTVLQPYTERGVGTALLAHVLALAKRLMMKNICLSVDSINITLRQWFEQFGFVADGEIVEFQREGSAVPGAP